MSESRKIDCVAAEVKANVYFEGRVVSHSVHGRNGRKVTLGLIYPGSYRFNTGSPERMTLTSGTCRILLGSGASASYAAGDSFTVPGESSFTIRVEDGICEYVCEFL